MVRPFTSAIAGLISLAVLLLCSCQSERPAPKVALADADTLISMVQGQIAEKKLRQQELMRFRDRYLPRNFDVKIREYYPIIRKYCKRYGLDTRLIIAQILKESYFREDARSHVGAMGLMQIMPWTAHEIRQELDIEYIARDPRENITAGIYYMYKQLQHFSEADPVNRTKLALAAYNCGPGRIFDAREIARYKGLDPSTWEAVRECLPLLTTRDWRLHLEVWEQGTPERGYFYGYEQTIDYVDDIYVKYEIIQQLFP